MKDAGRKKQSQFLFFVASVGRNRKSSKVAFCAPGQYPLFPLPPFLSVSSEPTIRRSLKLFYLEKRGSERRFSGGRTVRGVKLKGLHVRIPCFVMLGRGGGGAGRGGGVVCVREGSGGRGGGSRFPEEGYIRSACFEHV